MAFIETLLYPVVTIIIVTVRLLIWCLCLNLADEDSAAGDEAAGGGAPEEAGSGQDKSGDFATLS